MICKYLAFKMKANLTSQPRKKMRELDREVRGEISGLEYNDLSI